MTTTVPNWRQVLAGDSLVADCSTFLIDTAPIAHGGLTPAILDYRLGQTHLNSGINMFELYLYSPTGAAPYSYTVALDLSLKRPTPNNSSSSPARKDWCITVGISKACTDNADVIYPQIKLFLKEQLETHHRKLFVVWESTGTFVPGVKIDELFKRLDDDPKVLTVPNKASLTTPEPVYAHYKSFLGAGKKIRRMRITQIKF